MQAGMFTTGSPSSKREEERQVRQAAPGSKQLTDIRLVEWEFRLSSTEM
jgi:hypothetical protein